MCYRTKRIRNPKLFPTEADPIFMEVPCRDCYECRKSLVDGFRMRSKAEAARSSFMVFVSLTYNKRSLPYCQCRSSEYFNILQYYQKIKKIYDKPEKLPYPYIKEGKNYVPGFDKKHVQQFFKRLRMRLDRVANIYHLDKFPDFRYLLTSEYGGKFGRPHYHMLLFFEYAPIISIDSLKWEIFRSWGAFERKGHRLGDPKFLPYCDYQRIDVEEVKDNLACANYITKYISKDVLSNPHGRPIYKVSEKGTFGIDSGRTLHNFYRISNGFGSNLNSYISDADLLRGTFIDPWQDQSVKGSDIPHAIPQYINYKRLYTNPEVAELVDPATGECVEKIRRVRTEFGEQVSYQHKLSRAKQIYKYNEEVCSGLKDHFFKSIEFDFDRSSHVPSLSLDSFCNFVVQCMYYPATEYLYGFETDTGQAVQTMVDNFYKYREKTSILAQASKVREDKAFAYYKHKYGYTRAQVRRLKLSLNIHGI